MRRLILTILCSLALSAPTLGAGLMKPKPAVAELPPHAEFTFDRHEVAIGPAERQTVLTGFLLGGAIADLAVVKIDENLDRRLRIYAFRDGTWTPIVDAKLRPEVSFVDVARIGGRERLITYEPGRLNWFDPESARERMLVAVTSSFNPPPRGEVLHVDVTQDVNDDGRDDLVVPRFHGFRVFVQMSGGEFADPVMVGPPTGMGRIYGADGYRYDPWNQGGRIHEMDYDQDGRTDLVFWDRDHFELHRQNERGLFAREAETFTTEVAFDSDEIAWLAAPQGVHERQTDHMPAGKLTGRVLHSISDMNGDGVADLVVFSLEGGSLWKMRSAYQVHFGVPGSGGTAFASEVGAEIRSDGIPFGVGRHDFDRDGQLDMTFTTINPGVFKAIGMLASAIFTGTVSMDLDFYRMENGHYPDQPNATRKIKAGVRDAEDRAARFPAVLIGDVNGDRRSDLLVQKGREGLRVFLGVPGARLFDRRPQRVKVAMPGDEEYTWLADLDDDGKQDIVIHQPSTTEPHRVTMLITHRGVAR